jgi:hypothetical protein
MTPHLTAPALATITDGQGWKQVGELGCTTNGFAIVQVTTRQLDHDVAGVAAVAVTLEVQGQPTADPLASGLSDMPGILEVTATDLAGGTD